MEEKKIDKNGRKKQRENQKREITKGGKEEYG